MTNVHLLPVQFSSSVNIWLDGSVYWVTPISARKVGAYNNILLSSLIDRQDFTFLAIVLRSPFNYTSVRGSPFCSIFPEYHISLLIRKVEKSLLDKNKFIILESFFALSIYLLDNLFIAARSIFFSRTPPCHVWI